MVRSEGAKKNKASPDQEALDSLILRDSLGSGGASERQSEVGRVSGGGRELVIEEGKEAEITA